MEFVSQEGEAGGGENIFIAASDGDLARVQQLIGEGTSVNAQDESGYSPLHAAASYGHTELIEFLLSAGATVDLEDADGDTPLLYAEEPEVFELLVRHGADRLKRNKQGEGVFEKLLDDENEVMMKYVIEKVLLFRAPCAATSPLPHPSIPTPCWLPCALTWWWRQGMVDDPDMLAKMLRNIEVPTPAPRLLAVSASWCRRCHYSLSPFDRSGGGRTRGWGDGNRGGGRGRGRKGRGGGGAGGRGTPREQARCQC